MQHHAVCPRLPFFDSRWSSTHPWRWISQSGQQYFVKLEVEDDQSSGITAFSVCVTHKYRGQAADFYCGGGGEGGVHYQLRHQVGGRRKKLQHLDAAAFSVAKQCNYQVYGSGCLYMGCFTHTEAWPVDTNGSGGRYLAESRLRRVGWRPVLMDWDQWAQGKLFG
eukprot:9487390-Pyramimonas_sp.AAC.1